MIEMAHLVTVLMDKPDRGQPNQPVETIVDELIRNLIELSEMPEHPDAVIIEHRSLELGDGRSAKNDYRILYDPVILDNHAAAGVILRLGVRMSHLAGWLGKAFGILADGGIKKLCIKLPGSDQASLTALKMALMIISRFFQIPIHESKLLFQVDGKLREVPVIQYPPGNPNLELTLLAAANSLSPDQIQRQLLEVPKKGGTIQSDDISKIIVTETSLRRPPIEIVWQKGRTKKLFAADRQEEEKSALVLAGKLQLMSGMLNAAANRPDRARILPVVLEKIHQELERLHADDLASIEIQKQGLSIQRGAQNLIVGLVNNHIIGLLELVKERVDTCRKISAIENYGFRFSRPDCSGLARDLHMDEKEVRNILNLLGGCYDSNGRFLRREFESRIDQFVKYEKRIFEFLWGFLKQTQNRIDRLGFLNSLQKVIMKLNRPKRFLRFLLADVCSNPEQVNYTDRNALMLANVLLRTYNKELDIDIELTPEEVLLVRNGIDEDVVKYAKWRIESDANRIIAKIKTIHDNIEKQLLEGWQSEMFPLRFLLALEREFIIFLALVSGEPAIMVLTDLSNCYGDPYHPIYKAGRGIQYLPEMMQQLKITVRGLGRIGSRADVKKLRILHEKASAFAGMPNVGKSNSEIENTLDWIKRSITEIERRHVLD